MKHFTSEDNLTGYFLRHGDRLGETEAERMSRKIKSIKHALKSAQRHNAELHQRIKNMKENHHIEMLQAKTQIQKYRQLYEMLRENYEITNGELKEQRKRKVEFEGLNEAEQLGYRETIFGQERELAKMKEENRLLYEQISQKNTKIRGLEALSSRSLTPSRSESKDKLFLSNLKSAIELKNQQFEKVNHEKTKLQSAKGELEKQVHELTKQLARKTTDLEDERRQAAQYKQRISKAERQAERLSSENRELNSKYGELLRFDYDFQKDMERQLSAVAKDLGKRINKSFI